MTASASEPTSPTEVAEDALVAHGDVRADRHETPPRQRYHGLDGLRGVAALGVVLYHFSYGYPKEIEPAPIPDIAVPFGNAGVYLFFVLSGFVIFLSLNHVKRVRDFIVSRATRMYPAYWVAVILTFSAVRLFELPKDQVSLGVAAMNLTMLQGFFVKAQHVYVDGAYWTLRPELSFYLICGIALLLRRVHWLHWILTGLCGLSFIDAIDQHWPVHVPPVLRTLFTLKYLPMFTCGVLAWHLLQGKPTRTLAWQFLFALITIAVSFDLAMAVGIAAATAVVTCATSPRIPLVGTPPLRFLGYVSYSWYLTHQNIGYIIIRAAHRHDIGPNASALLAIASTLLLATMISLLVEYPAMRALRALYREFVSRRSISQST